MTKLVRSEFLKMRTTNSWWLFALGALGLLAVAFLYNALVAHYLFGDASPEGMSAQDAANFEATRTSVYQAANLFTSGQFFGLLFVMLLGIVLVTNEFHHQTATTTFLTTPHRTLVVLAKLVTAALGGAGLWLVSTVINIPATKIFLGTEHVSDHLGEWPITRAILLNLLAYTLWGILGVGFGILIRSQIAATVTAVVLYLVGTTVAGIAFTLVSRALDAEWVEKLQVTVPSIASSLMITGSKLPGNPPQWSGAAVLIGYALVTGAIGTMLVRRRDIS
jgi:ABC-2 type transport system permease protein